MAERRSKMERMRKKRQKGREKEEEGEEQMKSTEWGCCRFPGPPSIN